MSDSGEVVKNEITNEKMEQLLLNDQFNPLTRKGCFKLIQ